MPEKIREYCAGQKSGRHLLVSTMFWTFPNRAGQLTLSLSDYSFQDAVQSAVTSVESLAKEKGLRLSVEVAAKLPVGRADERRIVQVLLNLVGNAIKFTDAGEVKIRVNVVGGAFIASVADTGPGIPKSQHERIFEEFQQVDGSSRVRRAVPGSGSHREEDVRTAWRTNLVESIVEKAPHLLSVCRYGRTAGGGGMSNRILVIEARRTIARSFVTW